MTTIPGEVLPLAKDVVVLNWKAPTHSDNNAAKIAAMLGAEVTNVSLQSIQDIEFLRQMLHPCKAMIVDVETLVEMAAALATGIKGLHTLIHLAPHLFVYGCKLTEAHGSIIQALSYGSLLGTERVPGETPFRVSDTHREWCKQFTGLSIGTADATRDFAFADGPSDRRMVPLILIGGRPFFVRLDYGWSDVFFVACSELADLDEPLHSKSLVPWFSRLVPLMIFLRRALGVRLWHAEHAQACIIIDDPLLKQSYGFLEYRRLLAAMDNRKFSTCIGFIPWNYLRSRKQIADLFVALPSKLSLCVHGCDHTGAEFAARNFELLRGKGRLALERMNRHRELTGVPFDEVMVFPQGLFSLEALRALDACGYLAAVNTELWPPNVQGALKLRDIVDVAITSFADFPLFGRHYPRDLAEFAFCLFLGKPAFVVEHHGYFRDGYKGLKAFVERLNRIDQALEWGPPGAICSSSCLKRTTPQGATHVRFYTARFLLTNTGTENHAYVLSRRSTSERPMPTVTVNGCEWERERRNDRILFRVTLDPGQKAEIKVRSEDPACTDLWKPNFGHNAKVLTRRILSEVRDNYVDTNNFLTGLMSLAHKL